MGSRCEGCAPSREIIDLRFVNHRNWPEQWIRSAAPGDLLLLSGVAGKCGGLLRLKKPAVYLTLSASQIWRGHVIHWPFTGDGVSFLRVRGNKLEFVLS